MLALFIIFVLGAAVFSRMLWRMVMYVKCEFCQKTSALRYELDGRIYIKCLNCSHDTRWDR